MLFHLHLPNLHTGVDPPGGWTTQTVDRSDHLLLVLARLHDRCLRVRPLLATVQGSSLDHDQRHLLSHQQKSPLENN